VVKAFAQENREVARFRETNDRYLSVNDRINKVWALFAPTVTLLTEVGLLVVWIFGISQVASSAITVGVLAAFLAYIARFYTRLDSMSRIVSQTQQAAAGAKRIFDILDHVSSVPDAQRPVPLERMEGKIEIRNIGFRYGSRSVLKNVSLDIGAGEMIGLVGHSGSGKSSLVNLICRFYDVTEGGIRIHIAATLVLFCKSRSCSSARLRKILRMASLRPLAKRSLLRRVPRVHMTLFCVYRKAMTRWWGSVGRLYLVASASVSRSHVRY
jgi:ATP-binding cassette subfamily B protein